MRSDKRDTGIVRLFVIGMSIAMIVTSGRGQSQEKQDAKTMNLMDLMQSEKKDAVTAQQLNGVALEEPVNPENYFVGPSDVISVVMWVSPPQIYPLTVTPEGTLIIPTVGEVAVADLSLAAAKTKILTEIRKKYISTTVTVTLVKPRPIVVSIVGFVLNPGLFTVTAVDRANKIIDEANKPARLQTEEELKKLLELMSTRNILLKHRNGTAEHVDLKKFYATREAKLNPYLREGDIIVVPKKEKFTNVIAVYGEVNSSGRFEYVRGDSLTDAIKIANGLMDRALGEQAIFSRQNEDGSVLADRIINIPRILAGEDPNFPLEPGDRIIVKAKPEVRADYNVDVKGAVRYPGTYPITLNRTHLSDVIRAAGGFTREASLGGARVLRKAVLLEDAETEQILNLRGGVASSETTGFSLENDLRTLREAVTVNFEKLFLKNDSTEDVVLRGEDQVLVPTQVHTIYVFGQVATPGHIPYVAGKDESYYIDKSGGFTDRANKGGMKVIKSSTKQWIAPGDSKLEEGDYIWVPTAIEHPFGYYLGIVSQSAAIISVAISLGILVSQAYK